MRLSQIVLYLALFTFSVNNACSDAPTPADAGTYGVHYPDHPDAGYEPVPGNSGGGSFIPPWVEKKWLIDPGPEYAGKPTSI